MKKNNLRIVGILVASAGLIVGFQNCAGKMAPKDAVFEDSSSNKSSVRKSCTTPWGELIADGDGVSAYLSNAAPANTGCEDAGNFEQRVCHDGVLSGNYENAFCSPYTQALSCILPWDPLAEIADGESVVAYQNSVGKAGALCESMLEVRECNNGMLGGNFVNAECANEAGSTPLKCSLDGVDIDSGMSVTAYRMAEVLAGQLCSGANSEMRLCTNGVLSGSADFSYASCAVASVNAQNCKVIYDSGREKQKILETEALCASYYMADAAPMTIVKVIFGNKEIYNRPVPVSCTLDGITAGVGQPAVFFDLQNGTTANKCSDHKMTRVCGADGRFSGGSAYKFANCEQVVRKTCRVVYESGGGASSLQDSKADCREYKNKVMENHPNQKLKRLVFDDEVLIQN